MMPASTHRNNYYTFSLLCTGCDGETIATHRFVQIIMILNCSDYLVEAPSSECCLGEEEPPEVCMVPFTDAVTHPASRLIQLNICLFSFIAQVYLPMLAALAHSVLLFTHCSCSLDLTATGSTTY